MRIMVLGADGYLGWPTCMYLSAKGHEIMAVDNYIKKDYESVADVAPLLSFKGLATRCELWQEATGRDIHHRELDASGQILLSKLIDYWGPDTVVNYADQPSAPYSMLSPDACLSTFQNNTEVTQALLWSLQGTDIHLIKLGTMGEYGTPNIDIEEGYIDIEHNGRSDTLPYPKQPGSFYHASKVASSSLVEFASRAWGLKATELNQGVVYGVETDETKSSGLQTSFHYDHVFGTVLNRFITQAVTGCPLTIYGEGQQTRGFLNIKDTLRCVELACLNPPGETERYRMRVFNQFTEQFSVLQLANMVKAVTGAKIMHISNPRVEKEQHYYKAANTKLKDLGLEPNILTHQVLSDMFDYVSRHAKEINQNRLIPRVYWRGE